MKPRFLLPDRDTQQAGQIIEVRNIVVPALREGSEDSPRSVETTQFLGRA
jgi:hypothetical protein